jgi:hypothetical protein
MTDRRSEPPLVSIRHQAALARTLLDELEEIAPAFDPGRAFTAQAIEELTRLGCRILEAAALLTSEEEAEEEEVSGGPRLSKCVQAHAEAEPVGDRSASYVRTAIERARG